MHGFVSGLYSVPSTYLCACMPTRHSFYFILCLSWLCWASAAACGFFSPAVFLSLAAVRELLTGGRLWLWSAGSRAPGLQELHVQAPQHRLRSWAAHA